MGLLDKLLRKSHIKNDCEELKYSSTNEQNECHETIFNDEVKEHDLDAPLWQSVQSEENREKDIKNGIDYCNVKIYFEDGTINNVIPDVNNYYKATLYNIDGVDYDITDISSVRKIPLPPHKNQSYSSGTPIYRLEYLLRIHAGFAKDNGNTELAYALMHKGTELLKFSNIEWQRHDYLREYFWLLDDDRIEEAQKFFGEISEDLPEPYSPKEYTKEIQHYKYALLKRNFKNEMPKSFSAYMRNYNKKDEKFQKFVKLAESIGIDLK